MRYVLALGLAALFFGPASASASAAGFTGAGNATLALSADFTDSLYEGEVRLKRDEVTTGRGKNLSIPLDTSEATLPAADGTWNLLGGFSLRGYSKRVFYSFELRIAGGFASLVGQSPSGALTIATGATAGRIAIDPALTGLRVSGLRLDLTKKGAKALNATSYYKGVFFRGERLGKLSFDAERILVAQSGSLTMAYDQGFLDRMAACGASVSAVAPATAVDGGFTVSSISTTLPLRARSMTGTIGQQGGFAVTRAGEGLVEVTNVLYEFGPNTVAVFQNGDVGEVGFLAGSLGANLTADGGTVGTQGTSLRFSDENSTTLAQQTGCEFPPGTSFGSLSGSLQVN